jgi:hypothetical protein
VCSELYQILDKDSQVLRSEKMLAVSPESVFLLPWIRGFRIRFRNKVECVQRQQCGGSSVSVHLREPFCMVLLLRQRL